MPIKQILLVGLVGALLVPGVSARTITYFDGQFANSVTLGSATFQCSPNTVCVAVSITFIADTSTVTPFSVTGASGFENLIGSGSVAVSDGFRTVRANFLPGQIFVSVDQQNGGVGFGSAYGPTYPLATYGAVSGPPTEPTYDLKSNYSVVGWGPFCPDVTVCKTGPPLQTTAGDFSIISIGPTYGEFTSTLATPEASTLALAGVGSFALAIIGYRRTLRLYVLVGNRGR